MSKKIQGLFLLTLFVGFVFLPKPASAFILTEVFSLSNHILDSIEEVTGPILKYQISILISFALGIVLLSFSSWMLELFVTKQTEWIVAIQEMVKVGHGFILAIANMFFALIFVIIAISYILKIDTFQTKKTLTKFLIIALLINFSLLFVNIFVDISQILYNTILEAGISQNGSSLIEQTREIILFGPKEALSNAFLAFLPMIGALATPFLNSVTEVVIAMGLQVFFFPNTLIVIIQTIFMFLFGFSLLVFAFLFAARVFVIAFLAILSPLAFICSVLPQTQKWWSEWLKHLTEWLLLGILFLFLLTLGFKAIYLLVPPQMGTFPVMGILSLKSIPSYVVYYFALFIFLVIIMFVGKSQLPSLAGLIIDQSKAVGGMFVARVKPFASETVSRIDSAVAERRNKDAKLREEAEKRGERFRGSVVSNAYAGLRRFTTGITPEEAEKRRIAKIRATTEKLEDPNLVLARVKDSLRFGDFTAAATTVAAAITKGGPFKKAVEGLSNDMAVKLGKAAILKGNVKDAEKIGRTFLPVAGQMGFSLSDSDLQKYGTIQRKLIAEAKGDEIKEFKKEFWKNPEIMEAIQDFWGGPQIGKAAEEFGKEFIDDYTNTIRNTINDIKNNIPTTQQPDAFKIYVKKNPRKALYLESSAAQILGLESIYEIAPITAKKRYKNMKEVVADK